MIYKKSVVVSEEEAFVKAMNYCAYQERCHQEVREKLYQLGQRGDSFERIIVKLIEEDFLNEERFAQSFVRGKFNLKNWGRKKIALELRKKGVSDYAIRKGLKEIEEDAYLEKIEKLAVNKLALLNDRIEVKKKKVGQYLMRKGYEPDLCWEVVSKL